MTTKSNLRQTIGIPVAIAFSLAALNSARALGPNLIVNGDFETGTLAGWGEFDQAGGSGTWFISNPGANAPLSGIPTAPNGLGGNFYALSDQTGPGCHVLLQSFTLGAATTVNLSWQMFVNSSDGSFNSGGLDYTILPTPAEYGRVDLLTGTATPFSTAGADVLANFYAGNDPQVNNPNPYAPYSFNVNLPAGTYQIRFAEVDNQSFFNMGVDNVSVNAVPEPAGWQLGSLALAGLVGRFRLIRKR